MDIQSVNISHEMRTPVHSILGLTDLLLQTEVNEQQKKFVENIHSSASCLLDLINNMLDFSKIKANELVLHEGEYDVKKLITSIIDIMNIRMCEKHICFITDIQKDIPRFLIGDVSRIRQIILNILSNAVKFTQKGCITLQITYKLENVHVCVNDSGIGISKKDLPHIFSEYFRGKSKDINTIEGSGVGLSISMALTQKMGGSISVKSKAGTGSTFTLIIPQKKSVSNELLIAAHNTQIQYMSALIYETEIESAKSIQRQLSAYNIPTIICTTHTEFEHYLFYIHKKTLVFFDYNIANDSVEKKLRMENHNQDGSQYIALFSCVDIINTSMHKFCITLLVKPVTSMNIASILMTDHTDHKKSTAPNNIHKAMPRVNNRNALVVDDNEINRMVTAEFLRSIGFTVDEVSSGSEALISVTQKKHDIIIMDYMMSEIDGCETTAQIRALGEYFRAIPIIALSACTSYEFEKHCYESGINDIMHKPIGLSSFIKILKKWVPMK